MWTVRATFVATCILLYSTWWLSIVAKDGASQQWHRLCYNSERFLLQTKRTEPLTWSFAFLWSSPDKCVGWTQHLSLSLSLVNEITAVLAVSPFCVETVHNNEDAPMETRDDNSNDIKIVLVTWPPSPKLGPTPSKLAFSRFTSERFKILEKILGNTSSVAVLQSGIYKLTEWTTDWQLIILINKCSMHAHRQK